MPAGFHLLLRSSDPLLPAAPGPAEVDGEITCTFPQVPLYKATFGVTFFSGSSLPSSDARW